jgi:hypothetical protein
MSAAWRLAPSSVSYSRLQSSGMWITVTGLGSRSAQRSDQQDA